MAPNSSEAVKHASAFASLLSQFGPIATETVCGYPERLFSNVGRL